MTLTLLIGIIAGSYACIDSRNCSNNGLCEDGICLCNSRYVTFPEDSALQCNYLQKSQRSAFHLAFWYIPGATMGVGELYLGNVRTAEALMCWFFMTSIGIGFIELIKRNTKSWCCWKNRNKCMKDVFFAVQILLFITVPIVWCIFWFKVMMPGAVDGNGVPLFDDFSAITVFNHIKGFNHVDL